MTLPAPRLFTYTIPIDDGAAPIRFGACAHWRSASRAFAAQHEKATGLPAWAHGMRIAATSAAGLSMRCASRRLYRYESTISAPPRTGRTGSQTPAVLTYRIASATASTIIPVECRFSAPGATEPETSRPPPRKKCPRIARFLLFRQPGHSPARPSTPHLSPDPGAQEHSQCSLFSAICDLAARVKSCARSIVWLARFHCRLGQKFGLRRLSYSQAR